MTTECDFERIWDSGESIIHGKLLDADDIFKAANDAWAVEKKKWREPSHVNCKFLQTLSRKNPLVGKHFREELEKFSFRKVNSSSSPSPLLYILGTLCIAAAGICTGYFLPEDSFLPSHIGHLQTIILGGAVFAWTGGGILVGLRKNKIKALRKKSVSAYLEQLKPLRQTLLELCRKVDA